MTLKANFQHQVERSARFYLRTMQADDIAEGTRLCRSAGWNQTEQDWDLLLKLNPQGCCVALKDERVIGTVTTVRYENRFAWIGMVLVDPAERGQGAASLLMNEALRRNSDLPSLRLDATPAGQSVYRKLGFLDEYTLSRMGMIVSGDEWLPDNCARPMTRADFPSIAQLDRAVFGADRTALLQGLFDGAPEYAWVVERGRQIVGYACGRHGFLSEHLGPIVAHDQPIAQQLVTACLAAQRGKRFIIDATHQETDWRSWLESIGFSEQRPFIRMFYRGNPYPGLCSQQYGILGPEFG